MNREYHKWFSPALEREMELLVFGHAGPRLLVFPSRKRRFFEYEDYGMIQALRHRLEAGELQAICVDGIDEQSLYCFDIEPAQRIARHLQFERYVIEEVLPFSAKENPGAPLTAHGCSFGAYHAVSIALRHPQHFKRAVGFGGRYDLTLEVGSFHSLFHGFYEESLANIMPSDFIPKVTDAKRLRQLRRVSVTLAIGEDDPFFENNVLLTRALAAKKIPHELHVWCDEAHRFRYWRQMARIYL
jgi:esterase/lipase superfamily enzyme